MSLTNALIIGKSALLAHQQSLATISHNIANAGTDGYHRQTADVKTAPPLIAGGGGSRNYAVGAGVTVLDIQRAYSRLQEMMYIGELSNSEYHSTKADSLKTMEALLTGSNENSLSVRLQEFWNSWQDIANTADNPSMRSVLLGKASSLTAYMNTLYNNLSDYKDQIVAGDGVTTPFSGMIKREVDDVNNIAVQIQHLNQIMARLPNANSNDILDQRDNLIRELSQLVNITVDLDFNISIGGETLVSANGQTRNDLILTSDAPTFTLNGNVVTITGGSIGAWCDLVDEAQDLLDSLDEMALALITDVNALHTAGYDLDGVEGEDFFTGTGADDIALNISAPREIAAAATRFNAVPTPNTGDGANALAIAQLAFKTNASQLDNMTFQDFFNATLVSMGVNVRAAQARANDSAYVVSMLADDIQRTTGVSVDQEMIDLISTQRAFAAAAKVIRTVDELLDTIINRM